jgi:hypothetical protein
MRCVRAVRGVLLGATAGVMAVGVAACHRGAAKEGGRPQVLLSDSGTTRSGQGASSGTSARVSREVPQADRAVIERARRIHQGLEPAVLSADKDLGPYIQFVGERVVAVARQLDWQRFGPPGHFEQGKSDWMFSPDMRFLLVDCKTVNAFTTGGPYVYVYNGLFQQCQSEDELAAILAHEYAHVYARHAQNKNITLAPTSPPYALAYQYVQQRYTVEEETQADVLGWELYHRAGWDQKKYQAFFQKYDANRARSLPPATTDVRQAPVADEGSFGRLKDRARKLASDMPSAAMSEAQVMFSAFPSCLMPEDTPDQRDAQRILREQMRMPADAGPPSPALPVAPAPAPRREPGRGQPGRGQPDQGPREQVRPGQPQPAEPSRPDGRSAPSTGPAQLPGGFTPFGPG